MTKVNTTEEEYFADTTAISNSQLRNFASYNKYGARFLTPDKYNAFHVDKSVKFKVNEAIIVGKIVDIYFDGTGPKVWERYIPVARRSWKEIQKVIDEALKQDLVTLENTQTLSSSSSIADKSHPLSHIKWEGKGEEESIESFEKNITKEVEKKYMEITMAMKETAEDMINWGKAFGKFKKFLQLEDTEAQVQLRKEIEVTDSVTGDVIKVTMKGLPDFRNEKEKMIVDLKTTGNMEMVIDALQFRGEPKLTANYIRQLSIYNKLSGGGYSWALAFVTDKWVKWVHVPNEILENAWEIIERDIVDLDKFLKDPDSLDESIFGVQDFMTPAEDLTF